LEGLRMSKLRLTGYGLHRQHARGVSLVEALVALAVMSIGLLGVVGMQATLRTNAEVSRQRSEAVRMAQEKVESLRAFSKLDGAVSGELDYADILTSSAEDVTPSSGRASATFRRTVTVTGPTAGGAALKTVTVQVRWWDRRADSTDLADPNIQQVTLHTTIARVDPILSAGLGIPTNRSATQRPGGRNIVIPPDAITPTGSATSNFTPPGGGGVTWVFDNATGEINEIGGIPVSALLLSGFIRFATGLSQPTFAESETPPGSPILVSIGVSLTEPLLASGDFQPICYVAAPDAIGAVRYNCAVPNVGSVPGQITNFRWSGRSLLGTLNLASFASDDTPTAFRVCRYTPDSTTDTPSGGNAAHPLDYVSVGTGLTNQNFLVIRAGNGSGAFTCPLDSASTPLVDGDTRRHQPL
jgi:Tfp pilus assembly protein PilV